MKTIITCIAFFCAISCKASVDLSFYTKNFQSTIDSIEYTSTNQNYSGLMELYNAFTKEQNKNKNRIFSYWRSYLLMKISAIEYENKKKSKAIKKVNKAIEILEEIKGKNSDEYTLLALLQCMTLSYEPAGAMYRLKGITENINNAIIKDPNNIRANYVKAMFDYYTPEMFGGGQSVEQILIKTINMSDQFSKNNYLPSWGKPESYHLLIKHYLKKGDKSTAKKYYQIAVKRYPRNKLLISLKRYFK